MKSKKIAITTLATILASAIPMEAQPKFEETQAQFVTTPLQTQKFNGMVEEKNGLLALPLEDQANWARPCALSEDGKTLALVIQDKDNNFELYVADLANKVLTKLITKIAVEKRVYDLKITSINVTMSADGKKLAFAAENKEGYLDIYVADLEAKTLTNLTNTLETDEYQPYISPDGTKVAFTSLQIGEQGIYVTDLNKKTTTEISKDFYAHHPKMSNTKVLYTTEVSSDAEIYMADLKKNTLENLTQNEAEDFSPEISYDGTIVSFTSSRNRGQLDIYTLDLTTGQFTRQTSTPNIDESDTSISADGKKLVYTADFRRESEVYQLDLVTGQATNISSSTADDFVGLISGDGSTIAFASNRGTGYYRIYVKLSCLF